MLKRRYALDLDDAGYWMVYDNLKGKRYAAGINKAFVNSLIYRLNTSGDGTSLWVNKERGHLLVSWNGEPATVEAVDVFNLRQAPLESEGDQV